MKGTPLEHPAKVTKEIVPLGPTGHILYKASQPRLGDIADLPNTQKQTQGSSQNEETKKYVSNQRTA